MSNKVDVLFTGYSHSDAADPACTRANCTCTLVRTQNGRSIVVDTMTAWDGERLVAALRAHDVDAQDVYAVVCTHGHSDHIGGNHLFPMARYHFVGACASHRDKYLAWGGGADPAAPFELDGGAVVVLPTPGHTLACVSVVVRDTPLGVVGICGDLFERAADIGEPALWLQAGSEDAQAQRAQRLRMAEMCAYIIPGHGAGFAVTEDMRAHLRRQVHLQQQQQQEEEEEKEEQEHAAASDYQKTLD